MVSKHIYMIKRNSYIDTALRTFFISIVGGYHIWCRLHLRLQVRKANSSTKLRDVVMSSAAAPVYFPSRNFKADGRLHNLVDGELAANNPVNVLHTQAFMGPYFKDLLPFVYTIHSSFFVKLSLTAQTLLAIKEAAHIFGNRDYNNYLIVSLGSCSEEEHHNFIDLKGPLPWIIDLKRGTPPLANVLFKTSADMVDAYTLFVLGLGVGGRISSQNFLRIQVIKCTYMK